MASSSVQTQKLPLAGGWSEAVLSKLPPGTVREPVMNTEKRKIWETQDWWERHYSASIPSGDALLAQVSSGFKSSLLEHVKITVARGSKPKTGSTSSQQSVSLPVKEEKRGSKRASSSVADKPPKKLKKGIIDLTEIDEQNIDADLGRVIAKGAIYETTKNPSQDKISGPNNESSNSCLQPPPNKMPVSTIPETLEEDHSQETPVTEHASKGATLEEISTADSPPKGNPEENRQASPSIEANDQMKEDSPKGDNAAVNDDSTEKGRTDPTPNNEVKPQQQDPKPADNEGASNQKSPSPEPENMDQYFESGNEEDLSARLGGSSIDPQSSTSKISAAAGIPESLLRGLDVSTPEEALEKLLSSGGFNTNSEGTSAPTQDEEAAKLEQAHLEERFIEEFLQRDVLDIIDEDPRAFFGLKALLFTAAN
ncbi:hypothetical protein QL285_088336 [Trifolium repens]|nr:hypothetical protein QL285_088336 [Trifolium repens]